MSEQFYFDCPQCGHLGRVEDLRDHPTRPMPQDLGFCPKCGGEIEEPIREAAVRELLIEYGDDPDVEIAKIKAEK